jgi:hypothetical protein
VLSLLIPLVWLWAAVRAEEPEVARPPSGSVALQNAPGTSGEKKGPTATPPTVAPQPGKTLDNIKLPADAIVVLCEQAADALRMLPRFIVLSPEKFQEMQDEIARLNAKLQGEKPTSPSFCHLEGRVEGHLVFLEARFDLTTTKPNAPILLACGQAQPTRALLDGKTPLLRSEAEGYVVHVEKPGEHSLTVQLTAALKVEGSSRKLELDLPRAAGTKLKLDIPGEVKDLRVNDKVLSDSLLVFHQGRLEGSIELGPGQVEKLTLSWKGINTTPGSPTTLVSEGRVQVRVDERQTLSTEARLSLKVQGGQTRQWRLLVPLGARLVLSPADEERVQVDKQDYLTVSLRTLTLKEASADPLQVSVLVPARPLPPRGQPGGRVPIGPFAVLGATRQTGTLVVSSQASNVQFQFFRHGTTTEREVAAEERKLGVRVHGFSYETLPLNENPPFTDKNSGSLSLLDLEAETVRGLVETRVTHTLRLPRKEKDVDKRQWQVTSTLGVKLIHPGVETLEVQLPPDCQFLPPDTRQPDPVLNVNFDEQRHVVQYKLQSEGWKQFQLNVQARYGRLFEETDSATLLLPRPLDTIFGPDMQWTVVVPDELELLAPARPNPSLELIPQTPQKQIWKLDPSADRNPDYLDLSWRPYRPEVRAVSVVDLTLRKTGGRGGQVSHVLQLSSPRSLPARVTLRVPAAVKKGFKVVAGGDELPEDPAEPERSSRVVVELHRSREPGQVTKLRFEYSFVLPEDRRDGQPEEGKDGSRGPKPFAVPLVMPEAATQGETKVRVWSDPGSLPFLAGADWTELNIEEVKDSNRLPVLVIRTQKPDVPLTLRLGQTGEGAPATVLVERALVRATVVEGAGHFYHASFRITQLSTRYLDVELPVVVTSSTFKAWFDDPARQMINKQIDWEIPGDQEPRGRVARLRLDPKSMTPSSILHLSYELPPAAQFAQGGRVGGVALQSVLQPPVLRGEPGRVLTRWLIQLPANWVVLGPEGGSGSERTWVRRGWLLAPQLTLSAADLERWFLNGTSTGQEPDGSGAPSLVCWRTGLQPVTVAHVPQQGWLLVCSLLLLVLGLIIYCLSRLGGQGGFSPTRFWMALALLALTLLTAGVFWPTLVAAIVYGSEPGLVVLVVACLFQWLLQERHRRQIVFLPSFSRARSGSSMVRAGKGSSNQRAPGEPSTVDEPKPA